MIIALDPSGNWNEGKGTTGICIMWSRGELHKVHELQAEKFKSPEAYWDAHISYLGAFEGDGGLEVVMEGFRLYGHKSKEQTNSQFETPQLIGVIRHWCYVNDVPLKIQYATEVKTRWSDDILLKKEIIWKRNNVRYFKNQVLNNHKTDAIRHAMHYFSFTREKHLKDWENG